MHVIATAGHVDHGKSTLVDALTGMTSDRLEEERRRGLSIELGYVWATFGDAGDVAFVDVPGHERFVTTMLAGVGPVPAALLVVAADDPWMPQAAEHLAALDAFGVRHGVVAVTRSDLADPGASVARVTSELSRTSLRGAPVVPVSARTGAGLDDLRSHLAVLVAGLPAPDASADVRLWVDRRFTVRGAGTVVTGTLAAGTVGRGDVLAAVTPSGPTTVHVRGMQSLGAPVRSATGVSRVALNITGADVASIDRGSVLVTPDRWRHGDTVDVRVLGGACDLPLHPMLHVGAADVPVRARPLGDDLVRLALTRALPLRVGDRALLRDPGSRRVWGLIVLDPAPPGLRRRGSAARRAATLATCTGVPDLAWELECRGIVAAPALGRIGVPTSPVPDGAVVVGPWLLSAARAERAGAEAARVVAEHDRRHPLDPGIPLTALADRLGLPGPAVAAAVLRPPLRVERGRVLAGPPQSALPADLERAVAAVEADLAEAPYAAPVAGRLTELGLDERRTAAAARAGRLLRLDGGVVLLAGADQGAVALLADLPQPFTTSEARVRLGTSRRVVLPLLAHLDRTGLTRRLPDDRRVVTLPRTGEAG